MRSKSIQIVRRDRLRRSITMHHMIRKVSCYCFALASLSEAFLIHPPLHSTSLYRDHESFQHSSKVTVAAKKTKKQQSRADMDDVNRWYENVRSDATPDVVFWEEMERQRLLNQISPSETQMNDYGANARAVASTASSLLGFQNTASTITGSPTTSTSTMMASIASSSVASLKKSALAPMLLQQQEMLKVERSTESTLLEYVQFAVPDNWISEPLVAMFGNMDSLEADAMELEEQNRRIEKELSSLDEQDAEGDTASTSSSMASDLQANIQNFNDAWMTDAEPWDIYGQPRELTADRALRVKPDRSNEFFFTSDSPHEAEDAQLEQEYLDRMKGCTISSKRLEKARNNVKAQEFFQREPDAIEGFDRMWVCAIDSACYQNLAGVFRNYGVQFADNFADFEDNSDMDGMYSIEDVASFKARKVFEVTGLPVITARTSFEVEPIPPPVPGGVVPRSQNPLVSSGYRFNSIGLHVDYMIEALKPVSEPKRVCRYRTCLCYYDGEMELYEYSCLDCDIHWATSLRTFIPMNQAINQICKTLQLTFGFEYMKWLKNSQAEATSRFGNAVTQLRDRVLKDGRVLPNDIIDVSAFMDSMVDVNLMDDCAKELAERFKEMKPTKILTVATTGLVIALPMAKYLQVPVVYARKERNVVMADTFKANYSSKTVGKNRELLVSKLHILDDDRVLIVDDFLSSGASQDALLRIVAEAGAESVGVGVLLEKVYDSGRRSLSGFNVPVESLCRVASVQGGVIQLIEEEGFNLM